MEPNAREPEYRDRDLRRSRRLRAGVVSAGVVGSLGVAGWVGYAAVTAAQQPAAAVGTDTGNTFSFPTRDDDQSRGLSGDDREHANQGDDGWGDDEGDDGGSGPQTGQTAPQPGQTGAQPGNPFGTGQPPPQLQQGLGSPQGSTSGS